ncbi:MAG: isoprenylcysteine carboxylmethyltransferase family protein [Theionarchaea archaeon]|nr:isoprenylcysteine carboxylmethyltransferase family protein [Theionarchaea archaeon]
MFKTNNEKHSVVKRMIQVWMILFFQIAILFAAAGSIEWVRAWIFVILQGGLLIVFGSVMLRVNPELIGQRSKMKSDIEKYDKLFAIAYSPVLFVTPAVAGLDFRFGWSGMPFSSIGVGIPLATLGYLLIMWAMAVNTYFETGVRIQKDRGHQVCTKGPYQYVRHPGYVGMVLMYAGTPLILGSWWAFLPAGVVVPLLVIRTALEDRMLHNELTGYADYAQRVKYRLLPGVW